MERRHTEQTRQEFGKPPEQLLTARQVAKRLNVSVSWVLAHAAGDRKPALPSLKMGRAVRFRESDLETFLERCRRAMEHGLPLQ
jgi:excisionase family DNA binding protein